MEMLEHVVEAEPDTGFDTEDDAKTVLYVVRDDPATIYEQKTGLKLYDASLSRKEQPYFCRW